MIMMVGLSSRIGEEAVLSGQRRRVEGLEELFTITSFITIW